MLAVIKAVPLFPPLHGDTFVPLHEEFKAIVVVPDKPKFLQLNDAPIFCILYPKILTNIV